MKFPSSLFSGKKLPTAGTPLDARSLHRSITDTLGAAGLDMHSGVMKTVSETLQKAFADAGLGRTAAPSPTTASDVIEVEARVMPDEAPTEQADPLRGRSTTATHTGPVGSLAYRLFVPTTVGEAPLPLVVMLHGCTQSPDDFATGTGMDALAQTHGFLVAYPAQSPNANGSKCWNWFRPEDQTRDGGEPALIAGVVRDIVAKHRVDGRRIFVCGLSAGGAMAAILGQTHPELFAAIGVHSGLPFGVAHDVPSAFVAMKSDPRRAVPARFVPTIVFHGDGDATVNAGNGAQVADQAVAAAHRAALLDAAASPSTDAGVSAGGSRYTRTVHCRHDGRPLVEQWVVHGAGHAWSGGKPAGSYTAPSGPDASAAMLQFFLAQTG